MFKRLATFTFTILSAGALPAGAAVVNPTTESFTSSNSNWTNNSSATPATYVGTGSPFGDGYITYDRNLGAAVGPPNVAATATQVLFRGQDTQNGSNDAFVGNWQAVGITSVSLWVRHNAGASMTFGARFATPANFPGYAVETGLIAPNVWTKVELNVAQGNPTLQYEGVEDANSYAGVFGNLGNVQVFTKRGAVAENSVVTFDLDQVSAVPEPGMLAPAGLLLAGLLRRKRKAIR